MRLNVAKKLFLGFIVIIILMASLGIFNIISLRKVNNDLSNLYDLHLKGIEYIKNAEVNLVSIGRARSNMITSSTSSEAREHAANIGRYFSQFEYNLEEAKQTLVSEEDQSRMEEILNLWQDLRPSEEKTIELVFNNNYEQAHILGLNNRTLADRIENQIKAIVEMKNEFALKAYDDGDIQFNQTRNITLAFIFICIVLGFVISYYMNNIIAKPIIKISETISQVAEGNLFLDKLNVKNQDEIGELADAFNVMVENLRSVVENISDASSQVAATSQELFASSEETTSATEEIANSMNQLAIGSNQQAKDASEISIVIGQMVSNIEDIMNNINNVSGVSSELSLKANSGLAESEKAIEKIQRIREVTEESVNIVRILGNESAKIGEIVEVIRDISEQTNLLALNAAIEAARAGENGRGFAVVADEVRILAEQSSNSASEINTLIRRIQTETQNVVNIMDIATNEVSEGVNAVSETGVFFNSISLGINNINNDIKDVGSSVSYMTANSQSLDENMEDIVAISEEAAASSQEVSAAAEEQSASMVEIANASQELAELAESLQENISIFKLN